MCERVERSFKVSNYQECGVKNHLVNPHIRMIPTHAHNIYKAVRESSPNILESQKQSMRIREMVFDPTPLMTFTTHSRNIRETLANTRESQKQSCEFAKWVLTHTCSSRLQSSPVILFDNQGASGIHKSRDAYDRVGGWWSNRRRCDLF